MNGPTPAQKRNLNEAFESVDKYWYVDTAVKEFRRKPMTIAERILDFFGRRNILYGNFIGGYVTDKVKMICYLLAIP